MLVSTEGTVVFTEQWHVGHLSPSSQGPRGLGTHGYHHFLSGASGAGRDEVICPRLSHRCRG